MTASNGQSSMSGSRRQRRWKLAFFRGAQAAHGAPGLEVDVVPAAVASAPYTSEQYADVLVEADKVISQEHIITDKTLSGKIKGEEAQFECPPEYDEDTTYDVIQEEIFETRDVSCVEDKSMTKKVIREGEGDDSYTDTEKMKFSVESVNDGAGSLAGFAPNDREFKAGDDEVCDAMKCAVTEKKKGEKAVFTGSVPAQAQEEDLFKTKDVEFAKDKTMMKQAIREGGGHDSHKDTTKAKLSVESVTDDAESLAGFTPNVLEFKAGDDEVCDAMECAVTEKKKGEKAVFTVTVPAQAHEEDKTKDVSFAKDKTMMKKVIKEGEGYDFPKDMAKVILCVTSATDGDASLAGFTPKVLAFTAGNGEVCDALECAVTEMKKGEKAMLTVTTPTQAQETQLGLSKLTTTVVFTLKLQRFDAPKPTWSLTEQEKVDYALARKNVAGAIFKTGRVQLALERYKKIVELFTYIDTFKEEDIKTRAKELKRVCELNKAACYLRLQEHAEAKKSCDEVLKEESKNVKALYRRAKAEFGLKNFQECILECQRVVDIDPENKEARVLIKQAAEQIADVPVDPGTEEEFAERNEEEYSMDYMSEMYYKFVLQAARAGMVLSRGSLVRALTGILDDMLAMWEDQEIIGMMDGEIDWILDRDGNVYACALTSGAVVSGATDVIGP